ncbi:hypothetical protein B0H12DRAFT_380356 [Mycena haematopus]|nr:hypothetical protein B0H12DRAFT_380356 [Mycena haematopus]
MRSLTVLGRRTMRGCTKSSSRMRATVVLRYADVLPLACLSPGSWIATARNGASSCSFKLVASKSSETRRPS